MAHGIVSWIVVPRYEACRSVALQSVVLRGVALRSVASKYATLDKTSLRYDFYAFAIMTCLATGVDPTCVTFGQD